MPTLTTGQYLNQFVAPQLLQEFKNYKDDFIGVLQGAPPQAVTADGIRFNKLINNVSFLVNNTADFTAERMTGDKVFVEWEKYDTTPTKVDDAEIRYLNYDKRAEVRVRHADSFRIGIRDHVMWKLAPENTTQTGMPVLLTTGADDGTGRRRLVFKDLAHFLEKVKTLHLPNMDALFMILNNSHVTDLILDRDAAAYFANKDVFFDVKTGKLRSFMGFKFFDNNQAPLFTDAGVKKPKYAIREAGDQFLSTFFYAPETVYHLDRVKILFKSEETDTVSADPTSEFRTQTYGLVDRRTDYGFGGILSANI